MTRPTIPMGTPLPTEGSGSTEDTGGAEGTEGTEVVFAEPWQARLHALTVELHSRGAFAWPDFATALGARIAASEDPTGGDYWECWYAALTDTIDRD